MRKENMPNDSPTLVEEDIKGKKVPSPSSNGVINSRRKVRKSNSGSSVKSSTRQRGTERSKSDLCATNVTPKPIRRRVPKSVSSKPNLDASVTSTNSPTSDEESVCSYSLSNENDSIDSKPLEKVSSQVARINESVASLDKDQSRNTPKRTSSRLSMSSRTSQKSEREPVIPHSVGVKELEPLDNQKSRNAPKRTSSRSSEVSELDIATPPSKGESRLDNQKSRSAPKRTSSRNSELSELDAPLDNQKSRSAPKRTSSRNSELSELDAPLNNQKSRSAPKRTSSRNSELSELDAPLNNQKSRSAPKRTSSRNSELSGLDTPPHPPPKVESPYVRARKKPSRSSDASDRSTASPTSLSESSYLRGREKPPSLRSLTAESQGGLSSPSFGSPPATVRSKSKKSLKGGEATDEPIFSSPPISVRSKSKKSLPKAVTNTDDIDCSHQSENRKARSKSKSRTGAKLRSSSRKRSGSGENRKRQSRRSRTPSKDEFVDGPEFDDGSVRSSRSSRKKGGPVSEDEILQLLSSTNDTSQGTFEDESQPKAMRNKRQSKPEPTSQERRTMTMKKSDSDIVRRPRSNGHGSLQKRFMQRRMSNGVPNQDEKNEKTTRVPPRRSRSNDIGVDSSALDSFFQNTTSVTGGRRKKALTSGRSVKSAGVARSGSRTVVSTKSAKGRRRKKDTQVDKSLKSMSTDAEHLQKRRDKDRDVDLSGHPSFDEEDLLGESDNDTYDDDRSVDLDLATARENFKQQNVNEKLQLHLTKTDELLYSVFPKHVANALRNGQKVAPENHDLVTIFFSDIVGFTDISAKLDPLKISDMLDRLYNSFDALSDYHDVFKVETIGDAYMAVTNLTKEQPDHCKRITEFAIDAIRVANQTMVDENNPGMGFVNIRVGFHSGSVVSNVVGTRNPRYCLFGDTVNTASRMESNSEKNRIHCSETSAILLREQCPRVRIFPRGSIEVKGKGEMKTFWIHREGSLATTQKNPGTVRNFIQNAIRKR